MEIKTLAHGRKGMRVKENKVLIAAQKKLLRHIGKREFYFPGWTVTAQFGSLVHAKLHRP